MKKIVHEKTKQTSTNPHTVRGSLLLCMMAFPLSSPGRRLHRRPTGTSAAFLAGDRQSIAPAAVGGA
jgi:hypothetical protein